MLDYIIVGQGIAGSMLSWFLTKENLQVLVVDNYNPSSASNIASGITNPITGRRFVKSWLADEIIPHAAETYAEFEALFNRKFYHPIPIIKLLDSVKAQNDWSARCASPGYMPYLKNDALISYDSKKIRNDFGGFEISGGSKLEIEKLLACYRSYLADKECLLQEYFSFDNLTVSAETIQYRDITARAIIFCEGANAIQNPYFTFLPFQLAKGECLIIKVNDFYPDEVINGEIFIMPTDKPDEYYIGATHEWTFDDDRPTEKGRNELLGNLTSVLTCPFEILEQKAAIRPTVQDRRPFVGFHPDFPRVGIFNGMGTKGISLAPFFSKQFAANLTTGTPIMKEVDIQRFLS